jgi:hypothetical protein
MTASCLMAMFAPGAAVSKFAGAAISGSERTSKPSGPGFNKLLVSFDSEIRLELDIEIMRISESGH